MEELLRKIDTLTDSELQQVMKSIEKRYAEAYPQWDVIYLALHKDPKLRRQEWDGILKLVWPIDE